MASPALGMVVRNMGPAATAATLAATARAAEAAGLESVWVTDHVAIPPDEAEGSGGRYLDPLATLAYLAAATERIGLGTGVLILPYRPPLPTAKWVASVQELSGGRLLLGVGVGWMRAEFQALGIDRGRRGRDADRVLDLLERCFAADEVTENGRTFLFRPRPPRPPIFIGGQAPHALERAVRYGDGWLPVRARPGELAAPMRTLAELAQAAGRPTPAVRVMTDLPLDDGAAAADLLGAYAQAGVSGLVHSARYAGEAEARRAVERLAALAAPSP